MGDRQNNTEDSVLLVATLVVFLGIGVLTGWNAGIVWGVLVPFAAFAIAVAVLGACEFAQLAYWKLKRCASCGKRFSFPGWDWGTWRNTYWSMTEHHSTYWDVVTCPHCGKPTMVRESPHL